MEGIRLKLGQRRKSIKRKRIVRQKHRYDQEDDMLTFAELGLKSERHIFARKYRHVRYSNYPNQFKSAEKENIADEKSDDVHVRARDDSIDDQQQKGTVGDKYESDVHSRKEKEDSDVVNNSNKDTTDRYGRIQVTETVNADLPTKTEKITSVRNTKSVLYTDKSEKSVTYDEKVHEVKVSNIKLKANDTKPTIYIELDKKDKTHIGEFEHNFSNLSADGRNEKVKVICEDCSVTNEGEQTVKSMEKIQGGQRNTDLKLPRVNTKSIGKIPNELNFVSRKQSSDYPFTDFDSSFSTDSHHSIYYKGDNIQCSSSSVDSVCITRAESIASVSSDDEPELLNISDSEECDTDLEFDINFGKDPIPETDLNIGRTIYRKTCERMGKPPQRYILKSLTDRSMTLRNRSLGKDGIFPLCVALKDNMRVERLNLDNTDITEDGIHYITDMLLENVSISHLNLANNSLGRKAAQLISHVIVTTSYLSHLNLSGNKLGDDGAWYLSSGIGSNKSISHLDLGYNDFEERGGMYISAGIVRNAKLVYLSLRWNKIRGKGAVAIFQALMVNTRVEVLDISWNGMGYEGAVALSKCLKTNSSLKTLDMSNNRLVHKCTPLLAEGLRSNSTLKRLKVACNPLTTTGCMDILEAVSTDDSVVNFLDCSEIPVLGEADLLAATVCRRRKFHFIHGGIVPTHDRIGERLGRELNPMLRIIEYLRLLGLRPLELMKSFDKTASFELPRQEFVEQIKKIGVKLHTFEIEALANSVSGKGYNKNVINYRKLSMAVRDVVRAERERKIREREEWIHMKKQHEHILRKTQLEVGRNASPIRGLSDLDALRLGSAPTSGVARGSRGSVSSRTSLLTSKVNLSMCSPLDSSMSNLIPNKTKKKTRKKKPLKKLR